MNQQLLDRIASAIRDNAVPDTGGDDLHYAIKTGEEVAEVFYEEAGITLEQIERFNDIVAGRIEYDDSL